MCPQPIKRALSPNTTAPKVEETVKKRERQKGPDHSQVAKAVSFPLDQNAQAALDCCQVPAVAQTIQQKLTALSGVLYRHGVSPETLWSPRNGSEVAKRLSESEITKGEKIKLAFEAVNLETATWLQKKQNKINNALEVQTKSYEQIQILKVNADKLVKSLQETILDIQKIAKIIDDSVEYIEHGEAEDDYWLPSEECKYKAEKLHEAGENLEILLKESLADSEIQDLATIEDLLEPLRKYKNDLEELIQNLEEWAYSESADPERFGIDESNPKNWSIDMFSFYTFFQEKSQDLDSLYEDMAFELTEQSLSEATLLWSDSPQVIEAQIRINESLKKSTIGNRVNHPSEFKGIDSELFRTQREQLLALAQVKHGQSALQPFITQDIPKQLVQSDIRIYLQNADPKKPDKAYQALVFSLKHENTQKKAKSILDPITKLVREELKSKNITKNVAVVLGYFKGKYPQLLAIQKQKQEDLFVTAVRATYKHDIQKLIWAWTDQESLSDFEKGTLTLYGNSCPVQSFADDSGSTNPLKALNLKDILNSLHGMKRYSRIEEPLELFQIGTLIPTDKVKPPITQDKDIHRLYMSLAFKCLELSREALGVGKGHLISTVIVGGQGQILSWGLNTIHEGDPTKHAETTAIAAYKTKTGEAKLPDNAVVYTTLKSCLMCAGCIHQSLGKFGHVYYAQMDPGKKQKATILKLHKQESPLTEDIGLVLSNSNDLYTSLTKTDESLMGKFVIDNASTRLEASEIKAIISEAADFYKSVTATSENQSIALGHIENFVESLSLKQSCSSPI
jgi:tRNA(Arg) A34 adenosine deaminase TadA